jgi:hypothetical protein
MFFAEAEGFSHLHVHVVPRMYWFGPEQTGPRVFSLLGLEPEHSLTPDVQVSFSLAMQAALADES